MPYLQYPLWQPVMPLPCPALNGPRYTAADYLLRVVWP